ncbi:unnamed protein product [Bursaphelenchus xylophilus]|uniref:(pine wood nematode) hypothetical protein n=1 Tax=Bursaphelenchus xylophilus TaxID=6326 RepID=A0A1I7RR85_BURXY|nr:unnamed protein product [Bursaphelenchus xylophilus]CAG9130872.1 unnamed protein product [Bursaphelenchus xylophilus]
MSSKSPYIGSRINLISKSEIRYEGTLFAVDSQASTISLSKVRSFGTEDRPSSRPVKAREEVFEYVIFKATDIKDLVVMEDISPSELTVFDPAIVSMAKSSRPSHAPQHHERNGGFNYSNQRHRQPNNYPNIGGYNNYNSKSQSLHVAFKEKLQFDSDYDFVKANEQFEKTLNGSNGSASDDKKEAQDDKAENEEHSMESVQKDEEGKSFYNKDSFFDEISCEALEKAEGKYSRPNWRKERQTNQETFGPNAVRNQNQYHQRRMPQNRYMNTRPGNRFYGNCALPSHSFHPKTRNSNYIRI